MVQLTSALNKYVPYWYHLQKTGGSYFKRQALFHMTRYYKDLGYSQHKHALNRFAYNLKTEAFFAKHNSNLKRDYNRARIAAACEEHGYNYQNFIITLPKVDIFLNLSSLAHLAIYEPLTFKSLVDISRSVSEDEQPELKP